MNLGTEILIGLVLLIGGFGGGMLTESGIQMHMPPKTSIQNIVTTQQVETKTTSIQDVNQSQSTYVITDTKTNFASVSLTGTGKTNYKIYFSCRTNASSKTNRTEDVKTFKIPGLK